MKTFKNIYKSHNLHIVGEYFICNGQLGHLNTLENIAETYKFLETYHKLKDQLTPEDNEDWSNAVSIGNRYIRCAVARQGHCLDELINDDVVSVRIAIAQRGYGLEKLINDPSWEVRTEVAHQRYRLDILINDEDYFVRSEVAQQCYGLEELIHDEDEYVREIARRMMET